MKTKKKTLAFLTGAVVVGLMVYGGQRMNKSYSSAVEDVYLNSNVEALSTVEFLGCDYNRTEKKCEITVGAKGKVKLVGGTILKADGNGVITFDGQVTCSRGGSQCCTQVECIDLYTVIGK